MAHVAQRTEKASAQPRFPATLGTQILELLLQLASRQQYPRHYIHDLQNVEQTDRRYHRRRWRKQWADSHSACCIQLPHPTRHCPVRTTN